MLGIVPFLCWLVWTLAAFAAQKSDGERRGSLRQACVIAALLCGIWVVLGTELLSAARSIKFWPVLAWWTVAILVGSVFAIRARHRLAEHWRTRVRLDLADKLICVILLLLLLAPGLTAIVAAPSNWDSMTYHLPRQVYWLQQASVEHYPANFEFQLSHPPFAEFIGMHLMLLSGGDQFANSPQWFALAMTAIVASLIARDLGGKRKTQLLAAMLLLLIPTAFIWASNTKNGLVVAFWACLAAWWAIRLYVERHCHLPRALLIGATLGLLALTKSTAIFCGLATVGFIGVGLVLFSKEQFWPPALAIALCAVLLNVGHWSRNHQVFGSIAGSKHGVSFHSNAMHTPAVLASNVVRNLTLHLATPSKSRNQKMLRRVTALHKKLGLDVSDKRTSVGIDYTIAYTPHHEDSTPAPAHVCLALLVIPAAIFVRSKLERPWLTGLYLTIPISGFLLFCLMIKWMPWHARLHVPLLCLITPALAVVMVQRPINKALPWLLAFAFVAYSPTFGKNDRRLFGRSSIFLKERVTQRFVRWPNLQEPIEQIAEFVADQGIESIGLAFAGDEWEYPVQRLILDRADRPIHFSAFAPAVLGDMVAAREPPQLVIHNNRRAGFSADADTWWLEHAPSNRKYKALIQHAPYTLYLREDLLAKMPASKFSGFKFLGWHRCRGLEMLQGPLPHLQLPAVRAAVGAKTVLKLQVPHEAVGHLIADCRIDQPRDVTATIRVNGVPVGEYKLAGEFQTVCLPLALKAGSNTIALQYKGEDAPQETATPSTVQFSRLLLVTQQEAESRPTLLAAIREQQDRKQRQAARRADVETSPTARKSASQASTSVSSSAAKNSSSTSRR